MLGSCFTTNIGQVLADNKFNICLNPFGTLYNPASIANAIDCLGGNSKLTPNDLFKHNGLYHSFSHHGDFSGVDEAKTLENINRELSIGQDFFKQTNILLVTFGTAFAYRHIKNDLVVSNCHKLPTKEFYRFRLSVNDIVKQWRELLTHIKTINPDIKIILTVSPIRHLRDGAHDNQLSKAILLLAIDKLCKIDPDVEYFPSYEIVLDDLRDYRFYAEDMIHPNKLAVDYIWEIFKDVYIAKESESIIAEWNKIKLAINHRPFNATSDEHIHFLKQTLLKLNNFEAKYPYILLDKEREELEERINN